jgi:hypothetical protein
MSKVAVDPSQPSPPGAPFDWPLADQSRFLAVEVRAKRFSWDNVWKLPAQSVRPPPGTAEETIRLIPYGQTKIYHVSMFPTLNVTAST